MRDFSSIEARLRAMPGDVSMYFLDLVSGETYDFQADHSLIAASVIKLALLGEAFRRFECGEWDPNETVIPAAADKMPGCGALTRLHDGLCVTLMDLCVLMVILSDNTATNLLFDRAGSDAVNEFLRQRGLHGMDFNRRMFDDDAAERGIQNHITARSVGRLLEMLYRGTLVSPEADDAMLSILKRQQLNHKIPFFLKHQDIEIAHKTGEDIDTSHDAAIVYTDSPFVLCLFSNDTDVPQFERLMQDIARELAAR